MRAQTEKTTFSCKDDCTLTKDTWRWTYSALRNFFYLYSVSLGDALTTATVRPFLDFTIYDTQIFIPGNIFIFCTQTMWHQKNILLTQLSHLKTQH